MKYFTLLLVVITSSTFIHAQPVLQSKELPEGVIVPFAFGTTTGPGAAGANVTWDFSNATVSNAGTFERIDASESPYNSQFPNATYVFKISAGAGFYNHYNLTNSIFEWVGYRMGAANKDLTPDPITFVKFPMQYNDIYYDTVKSTDLSIDEVDTVQYDAYGTLITPYATYNNAVRIKTGDLYEWYVADTAYFTYAFVQVQGTSIRIFDYEKPTATGIDNLLTTKTSIYPNPASDFVTFTADRPISGQISIYNLSGIEVASDKITGVNATVSTNHLATGIYTYQIVSDEHTILSTGKVSIHK